MPFTQLIFDLDNTLYPSSRGVVDRVDVRINRYMVERLGIAPGVAGPLRARYRDAYGTTLSGLMRHHAIDPDDYLTTIHEIAVEELLTADAALAAMLTTLAQPKAVFTNGSAEHAERVLTCLDVRAHFAQIFSLESVAYVPKPERVAFETVLARLGVDGPDCVFVDDRPDNLATARALGMRTVLVGERTAAADLAADGAIASIHDLASLLASF
ncbi:MAG: pyrimidine 5'-nucleotidase [Deltaproteobacteria bacterium]|nr:pyrimidine 5'-nucleotidase [Deltaproteobacteria bacterium]